MRKFGVADLILNETVSPLLTLIDVAKPWIESSPALSISHVLGSAPGWVFSQATGFVTGGSQRRGVGGGGARREHDQRRDGEQGEAWGR